MRSTAICRLFGFASLALMVGAWLWAAQGPRVAGSTREAVAAEYYHRPDKVANLLAPVETQLEWLRALGYEDVDCWFKIFELALFGGRRAGAA